jgi:predicted secreted protein
MNRRRKGSAITEFGPALFLFLVLIFFPLMDLISVACIYCCGWYCNFLVTREAAVRTRADGGNGPGGNGGIVAQEVNREFLRTGVAAFIGLRSPADETSGNLVHQCDYTTAGPGLPPQVRCSTQITGRPFLTIPFIPAVPGLSAPITFRMVSDRPREVQN